MAKHTADTFHTNLETPVYLPSNAYMVAVDLGGAVYLDPIDSFDSVEKLARECGQGVDIALDRIFTNIFTREMWIDLDGGSMVKYNWDGMHLYFGNEATMRDQFEHLSA